MICLGDHCKDRKMAGFYENLPFFAVKILESVAGGIAIVLPPWRGIILPRGCISQHIAQPAAVYHCARKTTRLIVPRLIQNSFSSPRGHIAAVILITCGIHRAYDVPRRKAQRTAHRAQSNSQRLYEKSQRSGSSSECPARCCDFRIC